MYFLFESQLVLHRASCHLGETRHPGFQKQLLALKRYAELHRCGMEGPRTRNCEAISRGNKSNNILSTTAVQIVAK